MAGTLPWLLRERVRAVGAFVVCMAEEAWGTSGSCACGMVGLETRMVGLVTRGTRAAKTRGARAAEKEL